MDFPNGRKRWIMWYTFLVLIFSSILNADSEVKGQVQTKMDLPNIKAPEEEPSVTRFRDYLRLKAVQPDPDYNTSITWIQKQAEEIGLEFNMVEFDAPNLFAIWLTWRGTNQNLSSILLNSHIDVVPAEEDKWIHDPFGAYKDEVTGNIYGRGSIDMKSIAVQYLEAIRNLKDQGITPLRNVHVAFIPDEETGGTRGMAPFVQSTEFKNLNIGFVLDEGKPNPNDEFAFYLAWTERATWQIQFTAQGQSGHASILYDNTAAEKIQKLINLFLDLRTSEKERMEAEDLELGAVTSINLTTMKGGQQPNVVPAELSIGFDMRITPYWNLTQVQNILDNFTTMAGPNVTYEFVYKSDMLGQTLLTPDNIWWTTFQAAADEAGFGVYPIINPGGTDSRYIREVGIPAFGFNPASRTPLLAHDHNEFLNEAVFLRGVKVYETILPKFFNLANADNVD